MPLIETTRHPSGAGQDPTDAGLAMEQLGRWKYRLAQRQLKAFGSVTSFDVRGDVAAADAVCAGVELIQHATSLGAVESTLERRAGIPGQEHLPPALLRLSVGIQAVEDLWADLDRALRNVPEA